MNKLKVLKIVGITVAGVAAVGLGIQSVSWVTGNADFDIAQRIQDQLEDVKNEPIGCCLPQCGEGRPTVCEQSAGTTWIESSCSEVLECEIGCCYPYGDLAKASCEEIGGDNWYKGPCEKGFAASATGAGSKDTGGGTFGEWETTFDASTCAEDFLNAVWTGSWSWDWTATLPDGHKVRTDASENVTFTTNDGTANFKVGDSTGTVVVDATTTEFSFDMENLGAIKANGSLTRGSDECSKVEGDKSL